MIVAVGPGPTDAVAGGVARVGADGVVARPGLFRRLQVAAEAPEAAQPHLGEDLRALVLISLGSAEIWTTGFEEAHRHLEQGVALARRVGRPFLEFSGLADLAVAGLTRPSAPTVKTGRPLTLAAERARQAIELARRHGWTGEPGLRRRLQGTRSRAGLAGTPRGG